MSTTGRPRRTVIFLYILAGWVGLVLVAYVVLLPFLRTSARSERRGEQASRDALANPPSHVPSPQKLGYSAVVLERLAEHTRIVLGADQAWILVSDERTSGSLVAVAGAGTDPDLIGRRLPIAGGSPDLQAAACETIHVGSEPRGVVCVGGPAASVELGTRESELLDEIAVLIGEVLGHHERHQLTLADSEPEIRGLVKALAETDGDTYRHSLEVAVTARDVARALGLGVTELVETQLAALLHDVGKLWLPERVLQDEGPLAAEDQQLVRLHPEWGAEMVAGIPGLEAVALIVRLHHERPDGHGYPHGLTGEQIPVASRIVSVCAAYGVMTKSWPHRDAVDVDTALSELREHAGTQFDPEVVEALSYCLWDSVPVAI
jgi:putative nucleotidyltransferase with HDIG domain